MSMVFKDSPPRGLETSLGGKRVTGTLIIVGEGEGNSKWIRKVR